MAGSERVRNWRISSPREISLPNDSKTSGKITIRYSAIGHGRAEEHVRAATLITAASAAASTYTPAPIRIFSDAITACLGSDIHMKMGTGTRAASVAWERYIFHKQRIKLRRKAECSAPGVTVTMTVRRKAED